MGDFGCLFLLHVRPHFPNFFLVAAALALARFAGILFFLASATETTFLTWVSVFFGGFFSSFFCVGSLTLVTLAGFFALVGCCLVTRKMVRRMRRRQESPRRQGTRMGAMARCTGVTVWARWW